jgi:hypothetical protein
MADMDASKTKIISVVILNRHGRDICMYVDRFIIGMFRNGKKGNS